MEITKQFYHLLEGMENAGQPYIREELLGELIKVKKLINKLALLDISQSDSVSLTNPQPKQLKSAPQVLSELAKGCKETENIITLLILFELNHTIDEANVSKFLETYFNGIFKTRTFSIIPLKQTEKSKISKLFCQINKQLIAENAREIITKELEDQFLDSPSPNWVRINLQTTKLLRTFYLDVFKFEENGDTLSSNPIQELFAIKFMTYHDEEIILLTDCPKKNILLEKFLEYNLTEKYPELLQIIKNYIEMTSQSEEHYWGHHGDSKRLESIKIDYMDMIKKYF